MTKTLLRAVCMLGVALFAVAGLMPSGHPAVAADLALYADSLQAGWQDWSWGSSTNFSATSPVHGGNRSLAVTYTTAWAGLYLATGQGVDSSPYDTIQFWIHGGNQGGRQISLVLADGNHNLLTDDAVQVPVSAGAWTLVSIALADLGNPAAIGGIVWQEAGGGAQSVFYLDDISLTTLGLPPPPPPPPPPSGAGPTLTIDLTGASHIISDDIYGMNYADKNLAAELRLPVRRWGGNSVTRYNWRTNMHNTGSDWYFENIPDGAPLADGSASDLFVEQDRQTGTRTLLTVPLIGWTPKESSPGSHPYDCGFKVTKYGAQQSTDPWDSDCGNGVHTNGTNITGNTPGDTSTQIGPNFVTDWIDHLTVKYGTAHSGGVAYYDLDNEPMLWNSTHRDVHPLPTSYDELRDRTYQYAAAIKSADPGAQTLGPVLWGWCAYFYSAADQCGPGTDYASHGSTAFVPWYLQQMKAYEQSHAVRILDYLDLHFYPQANGVSLSPAGNSSTQALRLRSTRSLWDLSYLDESWISTMAPGGVAVRMIPRMKEWVEANYPGTKLAITEYNWGALDHINGALAQADVLGIFGREGLDLATLWGPPTSAQPGAFAFRMYRNYDGAGHKFGDLGTSASSTDQGILAVYAAQRSSDNALTVMVINKTANPLTSDIHLAGFQPASAASVYRYSSSNLTVIEHAADLAVAAGGFSAEFPGNSITLMVLMPGASPPPPTIAVAVTPTSATVQAGSTRQFAAQVTGTANTGVSWQVNGVTGGNTTVGTISAAGLYTAPAMVPSPASVTVKAASNADPTKYGTATVTVSAPPPPPVGVTITPTSVTVQAGSTQQFAAQVTGTANTGVSWQVNGVTGGNATVGTISAAGLYTAPAAVPSPASVTVKAVSNADPTKYGTATVTVSAPPITALQVLAPNGGEILTSGTAFRIRWESPATAVSFKLYYSLDNGKKWIAVTSASIARSSYLWTVPNVTATTRTCLVRVIGYNSKGRQVGADRSDGAFTIQK